ncbi:MAG: class I SAM-dependent methyltransferase [Erysipelotrichaceae bacterium]
MSHYFKNDSSLKNDKIVIPFIFKGYNFSFISNNGVFSKAEIDTGSLTLLSALAIDKLTGNVLDLGCGYGLIGITLSKLNPEINVHMVDINDRAVELSTWNSLNNNVNTLVFKSDIYSNVELKYNSIIINPPIRAGKVIVNKMLIDAKKHLLNHGDLIIVMRKSHGAKSAFELLKVNYSHVEILKKNKGFYVIKAQV